MIVSVNVGFMNMAVLKPVGVRHIDRSRKFSVQSSCFCCESKSLGCMELKSFMISCM